MEWWVISDADTSLIGNAASHRLSSSYCRVVFILIFSLVSNQLRKVSTFRLWFDFVSLSAAPARMRQRNKSFTADLSQIVFSTIL